ncbi:MAG: putative metal-binding motif-containing protein [Myxococcota bacterium]
MPLEWEACANPTVWGELCGQLYPQGYNFARGESCARCGLVFKPSSQVTLTLIGLRHGDLELLNELESAEARVWKQGDPQPRARESAEARWVFLGEITLPDVLSVSQTLSIVRTWLERQPRDDSPRGKALQLALERASQLAAWAWFADDAPTAKVGIPTREVVLASGATRLRELYGGHAGWKGLQLDIGLMPLDLRLGLWKPPEAFSGDASRPAVGQRFNNRQVYWIPTARAAFSQKPDGLWVPRVEGAGLRSWLTVVSRAAYFKPAPYYWEGAPWSALVDVSRAHDLDQVPLSLVRLPPPEEQPMSHDDLLGCRLSEWEWFDRRHLELLRRQAIFMAPSELRLWDLRQTQKGMENFTRLMTVLMLTFLLACDGASAPAPAYVSAPAPAYVSAPAPAYVSAPAPAPAPAHAYTSVSVSAHLHVKDVQQLSSSILMEWSGSPPLHSTARWEETPIPSSYTSENCIYPAGPAGGICCDTDLDYVTETCSDGISYLMAKALCLDDPSACDDSGLNCREAATNLSGSTTTRVCVGSEDCSDTDPSRYSPIGTLLSSTELCDRKDNNCEGRIDEDFDQDADGVTVACGGNVGYYVGPSVSACDTSEGDVSTNLGCRISLGDCDDANAQRQPPHPGDPTRVEVCDPQNIDEDCNNLVNDADPTLDTRSQSSFYPDVDKDGYGDTLQPVLACTAPSGYVSRGGDCNDSNANISPNAKEVCDANNTDEDCDGLADDLDTNSSKSNITAYYYDADGDGYGLSSPVYPFCDAPSDPDYVTLNADCNDTNPAINPRAFEVCDAQNVDEDCDGLRDDKDSSVLSYTRSTFYLDADKDSYGDPKQAVAYCDNPSNSQTGILYASNGLDCNDQDANIHPGQIEVCDANNIDENCNGLADNADPNVSGTTSVPYFPDEDRDSYGDASSVPVYLCDAPGSSTGAAYSLDHTDCDDTRNDINPAQLERCDEEGLDENCNGITDDNDLNNLDVSTYRIYRQDLDGDGYGDQADANPIVQCDPPSITGYAANADDCDDQDASIYSGADEQCDLLDNDCDGTVDDGLDQDGDGVASCAGDCDDTRADVSPEAVELCDARDNNCDTKSDETFDADGDGFTTCGPDGDPNTSENQDCNDAEVTVYPGAPELCDELDNNCNGVVNDNAPESLTYWLDQDRDGYGISTERKQACVAPDGYVLVTAETQAEDCNDQDPSVYPDAGSERLDGSDTNCDGQMPVIELDCDADGQLPISRRMLAGLQSELLGPETLQASCSDKAELLTVQVGAPLPSNQSLPNDALFDAERLSLRPCSIYDLPPRFSCLGLESPGSFTLVCDLDSGLWVVDNYERVKPQLDARRDPPETGTCDQDFADCDDQRGDICGCGTELCDGRDTNCARDGGNQLSLSLLDGGAADLTLYDGLPDAMQKEAIKEGAVSLRELDPDADGTLACTQDQPLDSFGDDLYTWSSAGLPSEWLYADCEDRCALRGPTNGEACDGVIDGACLAAEGETSTDPDGTGENLTAPCGYLADNNQAPSDQLYVLVYDLCPECDTDEGGLRYLPLAPVHSTLPYPSHWIDSNRECEQGERACVQRDPAALALDEALRAVETYLPAAVNARTCLPSRLSKVQSAEDPALELLRLCLPTAEGNSSSSTGAARCKLLRIELGPDANEQIQSLYTERTQTDYPLCNAAYTARTLWPEDRIRAARTVVSRYHCILSGECKCLYNDGSLGPVTQDCPQVVSASSRARVRVAYARNNDLVNLTNPSQAGVDLGPFLDNGFVGVQGWLTGCWTDVSPVGGACDDGTRDQVEGPRDIYGRLINAPGECGTCTDGLDNNCNGLADAEDPGCYPCFEGQGIACTCKNPLEGTTEGLPAVGFSTFLLLWHLRRKKGACS